MPPARRDSLSEQEMAPERVNLSIWFFPVLRAKTSPPLPEVG
ncbi:hypothetical protein CA85_12190 [Allorhodopirellula solitaria]|uniref:Uncharacterized protein n=1 Tax=Allorhodopirellula solitaria TaxID=2527987 RepID=A0A5C5YHL8_9BACT|nr:hypothetical protein CA85_12190 [Allorhodopirellula solitaria]